MQTQPTSMTTPVAEKVLKLLTLAVGGDGQEERTAAHLAARLIMKHGLLGLSGAPQLPAARSRAELLPISKALAEQLLDAAWAMRRSDDSIQVDMAVKLAVTRGDITEAERHIVRSQVATRMRAYRAQGVLVGERGPRGGYRMAPGVRRKSSAA
jgi:hypothetical protein